ncbi:MAG TPA: hypothetical protein VHZ55_02075 [Bryobacteraceae bacterium]|jgi:hypothetical protein|nr:hypothetical protein [Bryobacteraceae bacterium]
MNLRRVIQICAALILFTVIGFSLPPTIGIASAVGSFIVNSNHVDGNANLFDGSEVKTGKASSQIFLQSGASLTLGIDSAGTIYRDHLLLQQGATKVDNLNGFSVHAGSFRIEQSQPASQAVVRLSEDTVEVAALAGSLDVFNRKGSLLTHIGTGTASAFQSGAGGGSNNGGQNGPQPNNNNRSKYTTATALLLAATLAGLGLAVAAIVQPSPTSQ